MYPEKTKKLYLFLLLALAFVQSGAKFPVDKSVNIAVNGIIPTINADPVFLTEEVFIAGGCFDVSNATTFSGFGAIGTFSNGTSSIGIEDGIILSTGSILNAAGPNTQSNFTTNYNNLTPDPDLVQIIDNPLVPVQDIAVLEFDFTPTADRVTFEYVFASEEYCDFVNTIYNDIFGFFISGPGIDGPFSNDAENIALIPGTSDFVTINNINHLNNTDYFVDNIPMDDAQVTSCPGGYPNSPGAAVGDIEYDGFTTILTAVADVIPCQTYHIKLVIGDVTDGQFDSAVFLKSNSFEAGETVVVDPVVPHTNSATAFEGCTDAYFLFRRFGSDLSTSLTVDFSIGLGSTAQEGVDFDPLGSTITFGPGEEEVRLPVSLVQDDIREGPETLIIELQSACSCNKTIAEMIIEDAGALSLEFGNSRTCAGDSIVIGPSVSGGAPPYDYLWNTGDTTNAIEIASLTNTTYQITVTDACGNTIASQSEVETSSVPTATLTGAATFCNGTSFGELMIDLTGSGPWELTYSIDGSPQPAVTIAETPYNLPVTSDGIYRLDSVRNPGCEGSVTGSATVITNNLTVDFQTSDMSCPGNDDGQIVLSVNGGEPPYEFAWQNLPDENRDVQADLPANRYPVTISDAAGCVVHLEITVNEPPPLSVEGTAVSVTCTGDSDGSMIANASGGTGDFRYSLDDIDYQDEQEFEGLYPGHYTLYAEDENGCRTTTGILIGEPPPLSPVMEGDGSFCEGASTQLTVSGNFQAYDWSDGFSGKTRTVTQAGEYEVTVTNTNGCIGVASRTVTVSPLPSIDITGPEGLCSRDSVALTAIGDGLSFNWSAGNTDPEILIRETGWYTVTTTNNFGCEATDSIYIPRLDPSMETVHLTICAGSTFIWNNMELTAGGTYTDTLFRAAQNGCDSIIMLELETIPISEAIVDTSICRGEYIEFNGQFYTEAGIYHDTLINGSVTGCDSIFRLDLEVVDVRIENYEVLLCTGDSIRIHDTWVASDSTLTDTLQNSSGCDSLVMVTEVTVQPKVEEQLGVTLCAGTTYRGVEIFRDTILAETLTARDGCDSTVYITVDVLSSYERDTVIQLCQGDSIWIGGNWRRTQGVFRDSFLTTSGCDSVLSYELNLRPCELILQTTKSDISCHGSNDGAAEVQISGNTGPYLLSWSPEESPGEFFLETDTAIHFSNLGPGSYTFSVKSPGTGRITYASVEILEPPPLSVALHISQAIQCAGNADGIITTVPEGGTTPYQYQWNSGYREREITDLAAGRYSLTLTDANGCRTNSEIDLIQPPPLTGRATAYLSACQSPGGTLFFEDVQGGAPPYLFSTDGSIFRDDPGIDFYTPFPLRATVQDANGCEFIIENINPRTATTELIVADRSIKDGDSTLVEIITNFPPTSVVWTPLHSVSCRNCLTTWVAPTVTTSFTVQVTDTTGCTFKKQFTIFVDRRKSVFVPNAFSPNGDGINDYFTVFSDQGTDEIEELSVFDRWGNLHFQRKKFYPNLPASGWNGTFRGRPSPVATYLYYARLRQKNGEEISISGEVNLIR